MHFFKSARLAVLLAAGFVRTGYAQNDSAFQLLPLTNLDAFVSPSANWALVSDASANPSAARDMKVVGGAGAIANSSPGQNATPLQTKMEFGDVQLEIDFMTARNTSAYLLLMGRYQLQLDDSWTSSHVSNTDAGAIGGQISSQSIAPMMSVAHAPGLWQRLSLKFRAPQFDNNGRKVRNARFDEVYLNGVLVQQLALVAGPAASSTLHNETAKGPLVFAGGPVAFKNVRYRELGMAHDSSGPATDFKNISNPILLTADNRPYLLRSFVRHGDKKLTHVISYGDPGGINFSYDLKQAAIFQVWRGKFMNVTQMWEERGEPQLAVPLGSVVPLSDAPSIAVLNTGNDPWPDSVAFDDQITHGYVLNKSRLPKFTYSIKGVEISDSISKLPNDQGISRTLTVANPSANVYVRVAVSPVIEDLGDGLYALNGKSYYVRVDKRFRPTIRQSDNKKELIVKYDAAAPLTYSLIW